MKTRIITNIRKKIDSLFNFLNYDYRLTVWRFINRHRRFIKGIRNYSEIIRRGLILIICALIANIILRFIEPASLNADIFANYFISIGAMTGGIIAIVFTLSIFAQQSAADLYSSQYFEVYAHDWKGKFTYGVIVVITIIFFGLGIFFYSNSQIITEEIKVFSIYFSLVLIGLIFALVDWQYKNVRTKANPINSLNFLERQAVKFLNDVHRDAKRIARVIKTKNTKVSEDLALAAVYNNYLSPYLTNLDRQIENLFEISMKLSDRREIKTTNRGLTAVHNILAKYFELRRTSSLALASHLNIFAVESDSQGFLRKTLERLNNTGEKFVRTQKVENAIYIIDIYKSLAKHSKEIKFINRQYENPIFEQIKGYFGFYIDFAIREKDQEIVFQGAQALNHFALIAIEKNLQAPLLGIQGDFLNLAIFGATERKTFIVDECINGWLTIIKAVFFYNLIVASHATSEALRNIKMITSYMHKAIASGYLPDDFTTRITLSKAYDEMMMPISLIINNFFKLKNKREKSSYKSSVIELFEELYRSLRSLSEEIHDCNSTLIDSIGRLIFNINSLISELLKQDEFKDKRDDLLKRLAWNIHLPYWFVHHTETFKSSNAFNTLTDSVAKTGIILFKIKNSDELIMDCVNSLYSIVKQSLEKIKGSYGYDEPRIMLKIIYLGVLALKYNKQSVLTEVGIEIYEFEEMYKKKYLSDLKLPKGVDPNEVIGLPKEDQLYQEVLRWRYDFVYHKYNRHRLIDNAEDRMFELINELDIDRFMFEIWGSFPAGSPIEQEVEKKMRKKEKAAKMKSLIAILKNISTKKENLNNE